MDTSLDKENSNTSWFKLLIIGLIIIVNGYAIIRMYANGEYAFAILDLIILGSGVYIFSNEKTYAHRYIFPGIAGMIVFIIFPLAYTINIAFTNYSSNHLQSLDRIVNYHLGQQVKVENSNYKLTLLGTDIEHKFNLVLEKDNKLLVAKDIVLKTNQEFKLLDKNNKYSENLVRIDKMPMGKKAPIKALTKTYSLYLKKLKLITPTKKYLVKSRLKVYSEMKSLYKKVNEDLVFGSKVFAKETTLQDTQTGKYFVANMEEGYYQYINDKGEFVGDAINPGFIVGVGWKNFARIIYEDGIKGPFMQIFVWTVIFASASVAFTLAIGMVLACLVQWEELKGRAIYRVLLILPYAIPAFISILVFKGLFNQNFGEINGLLSQAFGIKPNWFTDPIMAKTMILIVNTWLGYPYMMILCMGLLKSIPEDLYEASAMDGASATHNFFNITVPLLMKPLKPLLIASFAFNFNNFVLIQLLTNGAPDILGAETPAGTTDLLVSYTFRIAFQGDGGQDFALASAIATLIFLLVGALALANLKFMQTSDKN